jgi:hypothetical protein
VIYFKKAVILAEPATCTAVVLFEFACLIRYDCNSKGKKNHFLKRKPQRTAGCDKHMEMNVW